jgi:hypothetical protein
VSPLSLTAPGKRPDASLTVQTTAEDESARGRFLSMSLSVSADTVASRPRDTSVDEEVGGGPLSLGNDSASRSGSVSPRPPTLHRSTAGLSGSVEGESVDGDSAGSVDAGERTSARDVGDGDGDGGGVRGMVWQSTPTSDASMQVILGGKRSDAIALLSSSVGSAASAESAMLMAAGLQAAATPAPPLLVSGRTSRDAVEPGAVPASGASVRSVHSQQSVRTTPAVARSGFVASTTPAAPPGNGEVLPTVPAVDAPSDAPFDTMLLWSQLMPLLALAGVTVPLASPLVADAAAAPRMGACRSVGVRRYAVCRNVGVRRYAVCRLLFLSFPALRCPAMSCVVSAW